MWISLKFAGRDAYRLKERVFINEEGEHKTLSNIMLDRDGVRAICLICDEIEEACPQLGFAVGQWAAMSLVRNYHKNRKQYAKRELCRSRVSKRSGRAAP